MTQRISDVIEFQLNKLNNQHCGIKKLKASDYCDRLARTIDKLNKSVGKLSMTIDGIDFDNAKLAKMKIPSAFKFKPATYESFANDGSSFALEVK